MALGSLPIPRVSWLRRERDAGPASDLRRGPPQLEAGRISIPSRPAVLDAGLVEKRRERAALSRLSMMIVFPKT